MSRYQHQYLCWKYKYLKVVLEYNLYQVSKYYIYVNQVNFTLSIRKLQGLL